MKIYKTQDFIIPKITEKSHNIGIVYIGWLKHFNCNLL
jgi:hypothetical protein